MEIWALFVAPSVHLHNVLGQGPLHHVLPEFLVEMGSNKYFGQAVVGSSNKQVAND